MRQPKNVELMQSISAQMAWAPHGRVSESFLDRFFGSHWPADLIDLQPRSRQLTNMNQGYCTGCLRGSFLRLGESLCVLQVAQSSGGSLRHPWC
jgi:hypothetical protein